jgi:hypothetical protein
MKLSYLLAREGVVEACVAKLTEAPLRGEIPVPFSSLRLPVAFEKGNRVNAVF